MATTSLRILPVLLVVVVCTARAQELRFAALDADLVTVARQIRSRSVDEHHELHTLQILRTVRGGPATAPSTIAVIDFTDLRLRLRPTPLESRLYCLHDATKTANELGLAADQGPFFVLSQRAGSNPIIGTDLDVDPTLRFCKLLTRAEGGEQPGEVAQGLVETAMSMHAATRLEATRLLVERPLTAARVAELQWGEMLARTSAETEDVEYKLAMFELCATRRMPGLIEAMLVSLDKTRTPQFARAVGRLSLALRGDDAAQPILARLSAHVEPDLRATLLLALGATRTSQARDALLRMKQANAADPAIDAALKEHSGTSADEASGSRSAPKQDAPHPGDGAGK